MQVLVTRPIHDARRTAKRLMTLGHIPVIAPVLTIEPTDATPPPGPFDALIVTSANGAMQLDAMPGWSDHIIYAVGPRTAAAIRERGDPIILHVADGDALSLSAMIQENVPIDAALLHITAIDHKLEPEASLRHAGYAITTWTAYQAIAQTHLPEEAKTALAEKRLDAAIHYSRRSVETLISLVRAENLEHSFSDLTHFCLSEDVAEPLKSMKTNMIIIVAQPSEDVLFDDLAAWPSAQ